MRQNRGDSMRKYLFHSCVLFIGLFGGYIFGINYESYEENEIGFQNHAAELLSPLANDYEFLEKGKSLTEQELRHAALCRVVAQRNFVKAIMRPYDNSVLKNVEEGRELLSERNRILTKMNEYLPEGSSAEEYFAAECIAFHH
jgi:hypothetical protein